MSTACESSKAIKRRRRSLTFAERLHILRRVNNGEDYTDLCIEFNIAKSTISGIKKEEKEILRRKEVLEQCDSNFNIKRYRGTEETEFEKTVFNRFCKIRHTGSPITGHVLQAIALETSNRLEESTNFKASRGWLRGFKARHSIHMLNVHGEKLSANSQASEDFKNDFSGFMDMMEITNLDYIYNCDETGLYWKLLPNKTFVMKNEKTAAGRKVPKSRLTVMGCTNASGTHKIPLFIIGKSRKPRCFKNVNQLPVHYASQSSAWMDRIIFLDWFTNCFIPAVKEKHDFENNSNLKIILLMDNAPCHPPAEELEQLHPFCIIVYLPPNVTSLIQSMDQGIIEKFKRSYKSIFLKYLLLEKSNIGFDKALKSVELINCFDFCTEAWATLTATNIRNCWKPLLPLDGVEPAESNECADFQSFQRLLAMVPGMDNITMQQTIDWLDSDKYEECFYFPPDKENNGDKVEKNAGGKKAPVSLLEAYEAVNTIREFVKQNSTESLPYIEESD